MKYNMVILEQKHTQPSHGVQGAGTGGECRGNQKLADPAEWEYNALTSNPFPGVCVRQKALGRIVFFTVRHRFRVEGEAEK